MIPSEKPPTDANVEFLRRRFVLGAAWSTGLRWAVKIIGLVSTAFLARLLTPADFGLLAMAMIVVSFVDVWSDIGVEYALIQNQTPTRESYDTAWTLRLLQAMFVALIVIAIAPLAAIYFKEPTVATLLWVLAASPIIVASRNIGLVQYRKDLRLDKDFKLLVVSKLVTVGITLACAWQLRDYRALVIGILAGNIIESAGSYRIHPFRPRFTVKRAHEFKGYWIPTIANGLGHFCEGKLDEVLVGRFGSTSTMGLYSLASELGQLPVSELAAPLNKTLLPALAMLQKEEVRLRAAYLNYQSALALIVVPAGVGLAVVADQFVRVLLGDQWTGSTLVVQLLAIFGISKSSYLAVANTLVAVGRPKTSARLAWASVGILLVGGLALAPTLGVTGIAIARLAGGVVILLIAFAAVQPIIGCRLRTLLGCFVRPALSSAAMAAVVSQMPSLEHGVVADLLGKILIGATTYCVAAFALWHASGRPDGGERLIVERFARAKTG